MLVKGAMTRLVLVQVCFLRYFNDCDLAEGAMWVEG